MDFRDYDLPSTLDFPMGVGNDWRGETARDGAAALYFSSDSWTLTENSDLFPDFTLRERSLSMSDQTFSASCPLFRANGDLPNTSPTFNEETSHSLQHGSLPESLMGYTMPSVTLSTVNCEVFRPSTLNANPHLSGINIDTLVPPCPIEGSTPNDLQAPNTRSNLRKRGPEEIVFPVNENVSFRMGSRRRRFSAVERMQTAEMREVGPCRRCKIHRVRCKVPGPCGACVKAAGSPELARHICIRLTLKNLRFGAFDLLHQSFTSDYLKREIKEFQGPTREISISLLYDRNSSKGYPLKVRVQDTANSDTIPIHCVVVRQSSFAPPFLILPNHRYAIVASDIPTMDTLMDWAQIELDTACQQSSRLTASLTNFMAKYCEIEPKLPAYELTRNSLTLIKLVHIWRSPTMVESSTKDGDLIYLCRAAQRQICAVAKKGIHNAEAEILSSLEGIVYCTRGPGRETIVPLWACLWALILTYRDCVAFYQSWTVAPIQEHSDYPTLVNASKLMYDVIISVYASLFRTSTPLYFDWRIDSNFELLGKNEELKQSFYHICTEAFWFYQSTDHLSRDDNLLRSMIIEKEMKMKQEILRAEHR